MPYVNNQESLRAGILSDLQETWRQSVPTWEKEQHVLFKMLMNTSLRTAPYVFKESLPYPQYWAYKDGRKEQVFRDRYLEVGYFPYELTIKWNGFDMDDDQLKDLKTHVNSAVNRYKSLPYKLCAEFFNGTAVQLPYLAYAFDGVSTFSATDGDGNDRFGVSGGNIITGSGVSPEGVMTDLAAAQRRFMSFVDPTAGMPIFDAEMADYMKMHIIIPKEMNYILQRLSELEFIKSNPLNNTSESNYFKGKVKFHMNSFLTDTSDFYVVLEHEFYKPFLLRSMSELQQYDQHPQNSDRARETNEYGIFTHVRTGMVPFAPMCIIKINN